MKLAPVVPPGAIKYLPATNASFCFADKAAEDPHYAGFFRSRKGVILDWPIYENAEVTITPLQLFAVAAIVQPDFLIVPDVRHTTVDTLLMARKFIELYPGYEPATGVLQGRTFEDYVLCADGLAGFGFKRMAIPKDFSKNTGRPRSELIKFLLDNKLIPDDVKIHLLGADWPYTDEFSMHFDQVISCDTAEAWNASIKHREIWFLEPPVRATDWRAHVDLPEASHRLFHQNIRWQQERFHDHGY